MKPFKILDIRIVIHDGMESDTYIPKVCVALMNLIDRHEEVKALMEEKDHVKTRLTVYNDDKQN